MTIRVLHILPSLHRGDAERRMAVLAAALPRGRFAQHACALAGEGPLRADLAALGVPLGVVPRRWRFDPPLLAGLRRAIRRLRPDVVHTWGPAAALYGTLAALAAGARHVVVEADDRGAGNGALETWAGRRLAWHAGAIVLRAHEAAERSAGRGLPEGRLHVIPPGVAAAPAPRATRRQLLAELGLPDDARLIGLSARLDHLSRIKDAIWAADLLKILHDDVHLLIVGDGPQRRRMEIFRDQCEIADRVHFLGRRDDSVRLTAHLDAAWWLDLRGGPPMAVLEAMAAGVPVVALDTPPARELIEHGINGYLVPLTVEPRGRTVVNKLAASGLCRHTNPLLEDGELAARIGQAGRRTVTERFSATAMAERYAALYGGLHGQTGDLNALARSPGGAPCRS